MKPTDRFPRKDAPNGKYPRKCLKSHDLPVPVKASAQLGAINGIPFVKYPRADGIGKIVSGLILKEIESQFVVPPPKQCIRALKINSPQKILPICSKYGPCGAKKYVELDLEINCEDRLIGFPFNSNSKESPILKVQLITGNL
ncbi:MAG: hypothetical protein LPK46_06780 [Bacteroidota bacterium]|nr:hypothetical protein [Bacteroidota bacterium]MDX5505825.1 hypothetical protein [Bacteroidota bacterium]